MITLGVNLMCISPWLFFLKDGTDENKKMCGNFHGSNVVVEDDLAEGKRIILEKKEKYNFTEKSDFNTCSKSNTSHKIN